MVSYMQARQSLSTSLMELLAIPLGRQTTSAKWLVIRRRPESSQLNSPRSGHDLGVVSLREEFFICWIPACAGMTVMESGHD
ncbi:MAG: hypothetical protein PHQ60_00895 [Sideroxydans sp.]|nr:hypothetical protein [Sideroxydans sp.]